MTKILIPLLAALAIVWLWRRGQQTHRVPPHREPRVPLPMVPCARCGVHVPRNQAVHGKHGDYCCAAHQREAEDGQ